MNFNPYKKKESLINSAENKKQIQIKEVLSLIKELAHDSIFEHDSRKNYHVDGTQPVNLLDKISRPLLGLSGPDSIDKARLELSDILHKVLNKAEEVKSEDVEKIKKVIDLLDDPEMFTNSEVTNKVADEIGLFDYKPQVVIGRDNEKSKIIEKQDYWGKPDPSLN